MRRHRVRGLVLVLVCLALGPSLQAVTGPAWRGPFSSRGIVQVRVFRSFLLDTLTGNVHFRRRLVRIPGRGIPLELDHYWNSFRSGVSGPLGKGWSHSLHVRYVKDRAGNVTVVWGDGRQDTFLRDEGELVPPPGGALEIVEGPAGAFRVTTRFGLSFLFDDPVHRRLTSIVDPNGNTIALTYDDHRRLAKATDTCGRDLDFEYDLKNRIVEIHDGSLDPPRVTSFDYDDSDRLLSRTDPAGRTEQYAYDVAGNLVKHTDRRGIDTTIEYRTASWDAGTELPLHVDRGTSRVTVDYDLASRTTTLTAPDSGKHLYTYDAEGRLARHVDPLGEPTAFTWDSDDLTSVRDRTGRDWTYSWDLRGNLESSRDPLGNKWSYEYGKFDRVTRVTDPRGESWTREYDEKGNPKKSTDPLDRSVTYEYDSFGQLVKQTDRSGNVRRYAYDDCGSLSSITDALGNEIHYEHDGAGRLVKIVDARGEEWHRVVDASDRLVESRNPLGSKWTYEYDGEGNLSRHTDARGRITSWSWDTLGNPTRVDFPDGTSEVYGYDAAGRRIEARYGASDLVYSWDLDGRVTSVVEKELDATVAYEYDPEGRLTRKSGPDLVVTYAYDAAGRRVEVTEPQGESTFTWDAAGNLLTNTRPNGVTSTYSYDGIGRLASIVHENAAGTLQSFDYTRDASDRVVQTKRETGETISYTWDLNGRVRQESGGADAASYNRQYAYDAAGNLTSIGLASLLFNITIDYTYDAAGRLVSDSAGNTYVNDANGARTAIQRDGGGMDFTYDVKNRLVVVHPAGADPTTYRYDALDRLVEERSPTGDDLRYVYGSPEPFAVFDVSGTAPEVRQTITPACLYAMHDADLGTLSIHPGGNRPGSSIFHDPACTLLTDGTGAVAGAWSHHADDTVRDEGRGTFGALPLAARRWVNGTGGYDTGFGIAIKGGLAFEMAVRQPLNPGVMQGNSLPGYNLPSTSRFTDCLGVDPDPQPIAIEFPGLAYTFLAVDNVAATTNTLTVSFYDASGSAVASTSSTIASGATWIMSTESSGGGDAVAGTSSFAGAVNVSSAAGDPGVSLPWVATFNPSTFGGFTAPSGTRGDR